MILTLVLGLIGLVQYSGAQIVQDGLCNSDVQLQANFDVDKFVGTWNEIKRASSQSQEDCATIQITKNTEASGYYFSNSAVSRNVLETSTDFRTLEDGTAKFALNVNSNAETDFWILKTDYNNYALVYSCENISPSQRSISVRILGREKVVTAEIEAELSVTLQSQLGIDIERLEAVDNSAQACLVLPVTRNAVITEGQCDPNIPAVLNFDANRFQGRWYEMGSYYSENALGSCNIAQYTLVGDVVNVVNSQVVNQQLEEIIGNATVASNDGSGKLLVTLEVIPGVLAEQELWILGTNYDDWAVSYSCVNVNTTYKRVNSWIVSRTKTQSEASQQAVAQVIAAYEDLKTENYLPADQSDEACFYYPEPNPAEPVVFRGKCELNITAMPNFDAARYLGLWHDIESYPSRFQNGQCNNAFYSLGENGIVDVYNTEVIGQTLDTMNGTAELVSDDGSGKLLVTFVIQVDGIDFTNQLNYWVLDTDYETYSVVYTCQEIDDGENRQVYSWKLSRTKYLTEEANTKINAVMSKIPVLDQRYYVTKDQSEAGCFYYPEPKQGVPVVFPGFCNQDIPVVNNFNLASFQGVWNEIEAYPKEQQVGQCIRHQFTSGTGNTLNMESTSVYSIFLERTSGVLSSSSADNSAKLTITINSGGNIIEIPFWILATDYDNYALAYSCVNIDENFRRVYSWKLSRTEQLLPEAATQINNVMVNVQVLDQVYFEPINQSAEACDFLPPGEQVIIPGQCNLNIPVVTNFDAARYLGLWNLVENYPSQFQDADCNQATYSLLPDGTVEVYNTQVKNETLESDTGIATVIASPDGSAKLSVMFPESPFPIEYWVLATDYDSYSLVYSCFNINSTLRQIWSWKLSRTKSLSQEALNTINAVVSSVDVLYNQYYKIGDNSDKACFYYPDIDIRPDAIIELPGRCDESIRGQENFNATAYFGMWYEIERYPTGDQSGECASALYSPGNGVVDVSNAQVVGEQLLTQDGYAVVASDDGTAQLNVTFEVQGVTLTTNYYVLATDYDNYALVYSCRNTPENNRIVSSWKLSRDKAGLSDEANQVMSEAISRTQGLREDFYIKTGQSDADCFYYPDIDVGPGTIIELPGPCDPTIQAQADFNATGYLGRWYEIRRYATGDQFGECSRAEYSAGNGVVDVFNSQVVDERLLIQTGSAVVASTDGSGLLEVTFDVQGTIFTANYYVLTTDYNNYALVYSCRNTSDNNRIVSSWQLSRDKSGLSNEAVETINEFIIKTQGLREDYYLNTSQSDDDCFYIPEVDLSQNEDVVFRGQCEDITGVQDFVIERYLGWWHEIERYPSSSQSNECTSSQFEVCGNLFQVVDMSVVDQNSVFDNSAVTATTNGRLRRMLSNGQIVDQWVLATDYVTYSLVYSCENIDDEHRRVWSAKHSKSRQLTNAAQNAMAPFIQNNKVLRPEFYREVDQSDDACFYYPEANGQPVILPGQCDDNIPVVPNFSPGDYSGTWYQIQRYPQRFELGNECTGARYTVEESTGIVTVENWEVIDGELDVIVGTATVISNDGSAKLEVVLPARGEGAEGNVTYPLYVLTTDYNIYSLAYSCVNVNAFERQLGVFKLSRTRDLPAAGSNAINAYMATRPELNQQYFVNVQHNEDCLEPASGSGMVISSVIVILACMIANIFV